MLERERASSNPETANLLTEILAKDFSLSAGTKRLINKSSFVLGGNEKIALIGRNGAGKTVLLETIYSVYKGSPLPEGISFEGLLEMSHGARIGYLPQDLQIDYDGTVEEYLDFSSQEITGVLKNFENLSELVTAEPSETNIASLAQTMEIINSLGCWDYQEKKKGIIQSLGLSERFLDRNIRTISGGEATKVALASVLISTPNIVLLDEPTNNLDIKSIIFLEKWIKKQKSTGFVIVSHDRRFLDNIVDKTIEIDEETARIVSFGGNYSFYRQEKQKILEGRLRDYKIAVRGKRRLEREAQRLKSNSRTFETTSPEPFFRRKGAKLQKKAAIMKTKAEKITAETPKPQAPKIPHIEVKEIEPGGASILSIKNLEFRYSDNGKELFGGFSFSLHQSERIAIIGPNGSGKSTFLKIIAGELQPVTPSINYSPEAKIKYLPQSLTFNNPNENLLDFCYQFIPGHKDDINRMLGKVLFRDASQTRVGELSLGELKRVLLSIIFAQGPDLLLLDEPVNHLDIYTAEMLDEALERYKGAVIAVSHDRYFLEKLGAKRLFLIKEGNIIEKQITNPGEISDIFEKIL